VYLYYIENVLLVEQVVHHIVYYLYLLDLVENDKQEAPVVEDNMKNIDDDIVEEVVDEKFVDWEMLKDI
jgi:hypothetical protein